MNVLITTSVRFIITNDGSLWTPGTSSGYQYWSRYLEVFDQVHLLARAKPAMVPPSGWNMVSGPHIKPVLLPYYEGPWMFLKQHKHLKNIVKEAVTHAEAVLLRGPCPVASEVRHALAADRVYGIEIVGDPYDVFAPGAVEHPLRPVFRWLFTRQLKRQCSDACAAAYVTEQTLQRRYPNPSYSVGVSDVELPQAAFVSVPRPPRKPEQVVNLVTVGSLAQLYKAPDVLIDAVASCIQAGLDLNLVIIGDGKYRAELEARVTARGVTERIRFLGQLPAGAAVRTQLDQADLFILPSRTEGLPRAIIEAMARGLPCIGSTVGGIPELLPSDALVPPGNVAALAQKIQEVVTNPQRMADMSVRNLEKSKAYREDILHERRVSFYRFVREQTQTWLAN